MELLDTHPVYWCMVHICILILNNFLCLLDFWVAIEIFTFLCLTIESLVTVVIVTWK